MKKLLSVLLALMLACLSAASLAETAFTLTDPDPKAPEEAYAGDWVCAYAGMQGPRSLPSAVWLKTTSRMISIPF